MANKDIKGKDAGGTKPPIRVLIVDDDEQITNLLDFFLTSRGYVCKTASNGREALEIAAESEFDVVITDIKMPEMDGITLTAELARKHPGVAIMVMTGFTSEYSETNAVEAGAGDFIKKPFTLSEFGARLQRMLRDRRQIDNLRDLAFYDSLTGLPNRKMLFDRLNHILTYAGRYPRLLALFFLDVDDFKAVNDSYGHAAGDVVLHEVSARLTSCMRKSDTLARMGGDEFVMILRIEKVQEARTVADRILNSVNGPYKLQDQTIIPATCSIGISIFPEDGDDAETLLKKADNAMYKAKELGGNRYKFFERD